VISFHDAASGRAVPFDITDVVLAGYTGRDQEAVKKHVEELAAHGVPAPERVPAYYRTTLDRVTTSDRISVLGDQTSGEAEFVLFESEGQLWVGVGSDHTDRALERDTVRMSKQVCPKVVSSEVWRYSDISNHWDHIVLSSFVGDERPDRVYQQGGVTSLMDPTDIMQGVMARTNSRSDGMLVFSGTLPLVGELAFTKTFAAELSDEEHGLHIRIGYSVDVVEPLD